MELMSEAPEPGMLAIFETPEDLTHAIEKVKGQKYDKLEAYTPFPSHEVIHALDLPRSKIPFGTLIMCLLGGTLGFGMQAWMNGIDWPINVAGKPFISAPAFIPVTFELTILIGGISTVVLLFLLCGLPNRNKAVLDARLTDNLFGLYVEKSDPRFNEGELQGIFKECHVKEIKKFGV